MGFTSDKTSQPLRGEVFDNGIDDRLMTANEVAEFLHIGRSTFYREIKNGNLNLPHVVLGGTKRFRKKSVEAWLVKNEKLMTPRKRRNRKWP